MYKTQFKILKMDCPSEENLIRLKLESLQSVKKLEFDLSQRLLTVYHLDDLEQIHTYINDLNLGSSKLATQKVEHFEENDDRSQKQLLWVVLLVNFVFFLIEFLTGIVSESIGLVADSLDMLADSLVYGMSLMVVGRTIVKKKRVAKLSGYFQLILALIGLFEVVRRFILGNSIPEFKTMVVVSFFALIANAICLVILQRSKSKQQAHIKASLIFTSNDIVINLGVITAGGLVYWSKSNLPDLIIGFLVFIVVFQGARRLLKLGT